MIHRVKNSMKFAAHLAIPLLLLGCEGRGKNSAPASQPASTYPVAIDPVQVGNYPALTKSGGGYFYDDVLEYRVWVHHREGGDDTYNAFATYEGALAFSKRTAGAEKPLVLVRQREWIDEPQPGKFIPKKGERITEWQVEWLKNDKRGQDSIAQFIASRNKGATVTSTSQPYPLRAGIVSPSAGASTCRDSSRNGPRTGICACGVRG